MSDPQSSSVVKPTLNRRSFLKGSALFTAALGVALVAPAAFAQDTQDGSKKKEEEEKEKAGEKADGQEGADRAGGQGNQDNDQENPDGAKKRVLRDEEGREYRVCPQCGGNMYLQGKTWTCESCGYSYVE